MKTIKNKLFLATAILALASCADNTYLGDQEANKAGGPISFGSNTPSITRSTSEDAAKLEYKFKVFGVKTVNTADQRVFATAATGITPYDVWFVDESNNKTNSNSNNWEYVGAKGQSYGTAGHQIQLVADQTIKYWDTNASSYYFQAWSDLNATKITISDIGKNTMTLTASPTQLANFWISDLKEGAPASFTSNVVQFTFRKAATKVRLGIYETVPGYHVRNLKFKYIDGNSTAQTEAKSGETNPKAILNGKFMGNSTESKAFTITYDTDKRPILTPTDATTKTTFFNFGEFIVGDNVFLGDASTSATWANTGATDHYTAVFPNTLTDNIDKMTLKIDYELYNDVSHEVIKVENKTAVVPATYMSWKPNYAYTYLFKITDDQLTPITLDAVVIEDGEGKQETITTVTEPSITTFGVTSTGAYSIGKNEYEVGTDIYATIAVSGEIQNPTSKYFVCTATTSDATKLITEASVADAIIESRINGITPVITCTTYNTNVSVVTSIPGEDGSTKTVAGAIKMQSPAAATYVVAYQQTAGSATATTADYDESATYYKMATTAEGFYPLATASELTTDKTDWATNKSKYTIAPTQPVYIYKVIKVVAAP